ncbi:MAG: phosphoribosylaminoimidazolesuccinocarboxamide synthase, partial [Spirochaetia bacterium]
ALFERGTRLAAERGLILVDTKYEFGLDEGRLVLVDENHTPDSSRYWYADTYEELFNKGEKQRKIDKEYLRQWLMEHGFMGNGEPPVIPDEMRLNVAERYITAYETVTGEEFTGSGTLPENEMELILEYLSAS